MPCPWARCRALGYYSGLRFTGKHTVNRDSTNDSNAVKVTSFVAIRATRVWSSSRIAQDGGSLPFASRQRVLPSQQVTGSQAADKS